MIVQLPVIYHGKFLVAGKRILLAQRPLTYFIQYGQRQRPFQHSLILYRAKETLIFGCSFCSVRGKHVPKLPRKGLFTVSFVITYCISSYLFLDLFVEKKIGGGRFFEDTGRRGGPGQVTSFYLDTTIFYHLQSLSQYLIYKEEC